MSGIGPLSYPRYNPRSRRSFRKPTRRYRRGKNNYRGTKRSFRKGYDRTGGLYGRFNTRLIKPELKYWDTETQNTKYAPWDVEVDGSGNPTGNVSELVVFGRTPFPSLNLVSKGNGPSEMIGRRITIKQLLVNGRWVLDPVSGPSTNIANFPVSAQCRMAIILDKQCNGQTANVLDIYSVNGMQSFLNPSNSKRFQILGDYTWDMNIYSERTGSDTYTPGHYIDFTKKFNLNLKIEFDDQGGGTRTINQIKSNNLIMMVWISPNLLSLPSTGLPAAISAVVPNIYMNCKTRIKYTDS